MPLRCGRCVPLVCAGGAHVLVVRGHTVIAVGGGGHAVQTRDHARRGAGVPAPFDSNVGEGSLSLSLSLS